MFSFLTEITVDGVALWIVLLICAGVFLGSFMDAIAGGGGIITVPTYLMGLSKFPIYNALGTNKLSAGIGTVFSTARFIRQGYVDWALFAPAIVLADEPTGNLDSRNSQEIMELLKLSNKKYSQTLVMITHDENLALQADRIIAIEDGRIARDEVIRR